MLLEREISVEIRSEPDVIRARQSGRELAAGVGFSASGQVLIAAAISELARNVLVYAKRGRIELRRIEDGHRHGIQVTAHDEGPGIADVKKALEVGYSSSGSLGLGLPGVKRIMDELHIVSELGVGTTVSAKKWTA